MAEKRVETFDIAVAELADATLAFKVGNVEYECEPVLLGRQLRVLGGFGGRASDLRFVEACLTQDSLVEWRKIADTVPAEAIGRIAAWLMQQYTGMAEGKS